MELDELTIIGLKYHWDTESHDRIHAHGIAPSGKTAMPHDRGLSSANAYKARDEAMDAGVKMGFTPQEVLKAISDTSRYSYEEICKILNRREWPLNGTNK